MGACAYHPIRFRDGKLHSPALGIFVRIGFFLLFYWLIPQALFISLGEFIHDGDGGFRDHLVIGVLSSLIRMDGVGYFYSLDLIQLEICMIH